jgi:DNA-binding GntR family transcriptional regulator
MPSFSGSDDAGSALIPARRRSLGEDVADRLRDAILHGELAPGEHLREEELASRLQVSRGPVRAALALLEREGLTRSSHHRGVVVAELSEEDLFEVYTLRSALELLAVRLVVQRGTEEDLQAIRESLTRFASAMSKRINARDAARLDLEFHDSIFAGAHHARLQQAWAEIRVATYKFLLSRNMANPDWRDVTVTGHMDIVAALESRNEAAAVKIDADHIEAAHARIRAAYKGDSEAEAKAMARPRKKRASTRTS